VHDLPVFGLYRRLRHVRLRELHLLDLQPQRMSVRIVQRHLRELRLLGLQLLHVQARRMRCALGLQIDLPCRMITLPCER
jgi:hypothetical protein